MSDNEKSHLDHEVIASTLKRPTADAVLSQNAELLRQAEDDIALRNSHAELLAAIKSPELSSIMQICDMFCDEYGDESMRETFNEFALKRIEARRNAETLTMIISASPQLPWVSVEERLPEAEPDEEVYDGDSRWVAISYTFMGNVVWNQACYKHKEGIWVFFDRHDPVDCEDYAVTHWCDITPPLVPDAHANISAKDATQKDCNPPIDLVD